MNQLDAITAIPSPKISRQRFEVVNQLLQWLAFFEGDDRNVRVTLVRIFLYIAKNGETTLWDICRDLEMPQSQVFRLLHRLSDNIDRIHVGQGLRYIERYPDPAKTNRYLYRLTVRGREVLESMFLSEQN